MSDEKALLEFTALHDEHPLRIEAAPGTGTKLVVSFTSVGRERDEWPPREFVGMSSQKGRNHVICVTDISRCWMNTNGMAAKVTTVINDYILDQGIREVVAIGSSMGAYNALIMGRKMPFSRIIAFAPQYSVHPEIMPDEDRWWWFRRQITDWTHKKMGKLPKDVPIYMFHGDTPDEQMHWRKFPQADNLKHYIFLGADHNFVRKLKSSDTLRKIMIAGLNNRVGRMSKVVQRAGGLRRANYEDYAEAEGYFQAHSKILRPASLG